MKENVPSAPTSRTKDRQTEDDAILVNVEASLMGGISVDTGEPPPLTPVESAILCMDKELQLGLKIIKELRNQAAMLETTFKLMTYELSVIKKHLTEKE